MINPNSSLVGTFHLNPVVNLYDRLSDKLGSTKTHVLCDRSGSNHTSRNNQVGIGGERDTVMNVLDLPVSGEPSLLISLDGIQNVNSMDVETLPQILEPDLAMSSEGVKECGYDVFPSITKTGSIIGKPSFQDMVTGDFDLPLKASLMRDLDM
ncbi:hypothetical protein V6N13_138323 [Hibiscus sabdariffa]|uniref:Uncharacterized protein n=1 Tax=Hibiscus sabdariffa TaxID=183260 RepID=A0ABR2QD48_9ROSI